MYTTLLSLPDGTVLSSGDPDAAGISSITLTQCANVGTELTPGAVCSDALEVTVISAAALHLTAGDELTACRIAPDGTKTQLGIFIVETPERPSANTYRITAYDRVSRLDTDITDWFSSLDAWPYGLHELASMACQACGLTLVTEDIPNGSHPVHKFTATGLTGRQLLQWVCQASGRFCRATPEGTLELRWYAPNDRILTPGDEGEGTLPYYASSLQCADYTVAPIEKLCLRQTGDDVGTIYPDDESATNALILTGNPLLTGSLDTVAETLFGLLAADVYTPCTVNIPYTPDIGPGDILTVRDLQGTAHTVYVMSRTVTGQRQTLTATGSRRRDCTTAVNEQSYRTLNGRILQLRTDVDGLWAEHRDAEDAFSSLSLTVEGIVSKSSAQETTVEGLADKLTELRQTADGLTLSVETIQTDGVSRVTTGTGYTLDDNGLSITRQGHEMENLLDNTGMYVRRAGEVILQAASEGVTAVDVHVKNYLHLGTNARLEDYTDEQNTPRTACFFIQT